MKIFRSQKYREWISRQSCLVCGFGPSDPHHENLGEGFMAGKSPDTHCVPLCRSCHDLRHSIGPASYCDIDVKKNIIDLLTRYWSEGNVK